MFGFDQDHDYDYHCEVCRRGYYAEVGFGGCPHCTVEEKVKFSKKKAKEEKLRLEKAAASRKKYMQSEEYLYDRDLEIQLEEEDDRPY